MESRCGILCSKCDRQRNEKCEGFDKIETAYDEKEGDCGVRPDQCKIRSALMQMRYTWLDDFLMKKAGVTKLPPQWNWIRYAVGGKMFAAVCLGEDNKPYYITLKLEPSEGSFLRQQYDDIIAGYYMNKEHWNSINPNGTVEDDLLKDLLDKSYRLVLGGFSKKKQNEILEGEGETNGI